MFFDTMFASKESRKGNKCVQNIHHKFVLARAHLMVSRGKTHKSVLLLFASDGVQPAYICNNIKK